MPEPPLDQATYMGHVTSVRGGVVHVRLRDVPTTLVMVDGSAHRIGQIGAFVRIPLGYTQLFGVCTQVGADPLRPDTDDEDGALEVESGPGTEGYRWMTITLFGEAVERRFDRGVGQYPTVGDEVHVVTQADLEVIYATEDDRNDVIAIGRIAGSDSVPAALRVSALVNRHCCVVGSTGAGKSNLVAVLLRAFAASEYRSARILMVTRTASTSRHSRQSRRSVLLPARQPRRIACGSLTGRSTSTSWRGSRWVAWGTRRRSSYATVCAR